MSFQFELAGRTGMIFHAKGGLVKKLLPKKISSLADKGQLVLVSEPVAYWVRFKKTEVEGQWEGLAQLVETLSAKPSISKVPTGSDSEDSNRGYCRLALYSVEPVDFSELHCSPHQKLEKEAPVLMKVLILSEEEFAENTRSPEVEKGSLSKLVDRCGGPDNVSFFLETYGYSQLPHFGDALDNLAWDQEQMIWESSLAYQISLQPVDIQNLMRNRKVVIAKPWNKLILRMNQAAVYEVLRYAFGNVEDDWYLQRVLLEEGTSADFELCSEQADKEAGTPIKCHRSKLAGASQVFADMLKETSSGEKAKSGTVTLPESEDTLRAMLQFIYYGETEQLFNCNSELLLDLLQAGTKYDIPNLVQAITFILKTKFKPELWFGVEEAVELYVFSEGFTVQGWTDLRNLSYNVLKKKPREELMTSKLLYKMAENLGPVFLSVFEKTTVKSGKQVNPAFVQVAATQQKADLLFDLLCPSFEDKELELNFGIVLGFMTLAEHSDRALPSNYDEAIRRTFAETPATDFSVDYLVQLFSGVRARGKKGHGDSVWKVLKEETVRKLKWYDLKQPSKLAECKPYMEMLERDLDAATEFSYICKVVEVFDF